MGVLDGRVAVVTGGNGGIGLGLAGALLDAGATVDIWARDEAKSGAATERLESGSRPPVTARRCDVSVESDVLRALDATVDEHSRLDIMVANAGVSHHVPFLDTKLADWQRVTAVDLDGVFSCFRAAALQMRKQHEREGVGGALVAVSSISALHGSPQQAAYAASKAGILGLVRSVAVELARYGVRANALLPGWTDIETHPEMRADERFVDVTTRRTPVRRWGTPDDLGAAIVFLADPTNTFHTGDTIVVDGGYTIQ